MQFETEVNENLTRNIDSLKNINVSETVEIQAEYVTNKDFLTEELLTKLSLNEKVIFQQKERNDEVYQAQKLDFVTEYFNRSPKLFLESYYKLIDSPKYIQCFEGFDDSDPIFKHYKNKFLNKFQLSQKRINNRRYSKLQELIKDGKYFSFEEMKVRQPVFYDKYVGRFLSPGEEAEIMGRQYDSFGSFLMTNLLNMEDRLRLTVATLENEEEESSSDEECDKEEMEVDQDGDDLPCTEEHKKSMQDYFMELMTRRFLNGEDEFDYNEIDQNSDLDDAEQIAYDIEDRYFLEVDEDSGMNSEEEEVDNIENEDDCDFIEYKDRHILQKTENL